MSEEAKHTYGHQNQDLGAGNPGIKDLSCGDDDIGTAGTAPGLRAVALGEDGVELFVKGGRLAQDMSGQDDPLAPEPGQAYFSL